MRYVTSQVKRSKQDTRARRDPRIHQCKVCLKYHSLRFCKRFLHMNASDRKHAVYKYHYCVNCLARSHGLRNCTSQVTCQNCGHYHHTLLHHALHPRIEPTSSRRRPKAPKRSQNGNGTSKLQRRQPNVLHRRVTSNSNEHQLIPSDRQQIISAAIKSLANLLI
ncbi:uncharacterized protein LOC142239236 [Haematobia irritans]